MLASVENSKRAEIIEDMYSEYTDQDVVDMISAIIKDLDDGLHEDEFNDLVAEIKVQVEEKIEGGEFDDHFIELFGISIEDVRSEILVIADVISVHYADTVDELEAAPEGAKRYLELIKLLNYIKVNEVLVYGDSANGKVFIREGVEKLLRDLPTFEEIAAMTDDEMLLSYKVNVSTDFSDNEFNLTLKIGGAFDTIRKIAGIIGRNVSCSLDENYNLVLDVNVPEELSKAILRACETGKISDELKNKVFDKIDDNGEEIYAFVNSVSLDTLIELLDYVDFDGILDSNFVSKFEKLDGLSADDIKVKIKSYEDYYNKAIKLVSKIYNNIPARWTEKSLVEIYDEETGKFHINESFNVNLADIAYEVNEDLANILEAFFDNVTLSGTADVTVNIEKVHKITFMTGDEVVKIGFLPVDATIGRFIDVYEYQGETIVDWVDDAGASYETMPDHDLVLHAITKEVSATLTASANEITYGDGSIVLTATAYFNTVSTSVVYEWCHDGKTVEGADSDTLTLTTVDGSGNYYCIITVTDAYGTKELVTNTVTVNIKPIEIDIEAAIEWFNESPFIYDGKEHGVVALIKDGYKGIVELVILENNSYFDAGDYTAEARYKLVDDVNYKFINGTAVYCPWKILPIEYDESDLVWGNLEFTYNYDDEQSAATVHTVAKPTAPENLTVTISDNSASDAGNYTAKVTVTVANTNYKWVGADIVEKAWKINPKTIDLSGYEWVANGVDVDNISDKFTFTYNTKEQGVNLTGLPGDIAAAIVYSNAAATDVTGKTLTASATINYTGNKLATNYSVTGEFATQDWEIVKYVITIDNIQWSEHSDFTYDSSATVTPTVEGIPEDERYNVTYEYYKKVNGEYTQKVSAPKDAGWYKAIVTMTPVDTVNYEISENIVNEIEFEIKKAVLNIGPTVNVTWDYQNPFVYNNEEYEVKVNDLPADIAAVVRTTYINDATFANKATRAGDYVAKVKYTIKTTALRNNYELAGAGLQDDGSVIYTLNWKIEKKELDLSYLKWSTDLSFTYNGNPYTVKLNEEDIPADVKALINPINYDGETATVCGDYTATAILSLVDPANYKFSADTSISFSTPWEIKQYVIQLGNVSWKPLSPDKSVYTGSEIAHPELNLDGVSEEERSLFEVSYTAVVGPLNPIDAGTYTIAAKITPKNSHDFAVNATVDTYEWTVAKADYDLEGLGITFEGASFEFDGLYKSLAISGDLPEGVTVSYKNNYHRNAGTYVVKAIFTTTDPNYNNAERSVFLTIWTEGSPLTNFNHEDEVHIAVKDGLPNDYSLDVEDVVIDEVISDKVAAIAPVGYESSIISTYNIDFHNGEGKVVDVTGDFTVRLKIPSEYRYPLTRNLKVIHITSDGEIEIINDATRSGYYMVFKTAHFSIYGILDVSECSHVDADYDDVCDKCGEELPHRHIDFDNDGICDNCGEPLPVIPPCNHVDADGDGFCDYCDEEMPDLPPCDHEDSNNDGFCDHCGEIVEPPACDGDHVDEDEDGFCDNCGEEIEDVPGCDHVDGDDDGICDNCGEPVEPDDCDEHVDADCDGFCDNCGEPVEPDDCDEHVDADDDGFCDNCGEPVESDDCDEHVDADGDGFCDNCGESVESDDCNEHVDADGDGFCDNCGEPVEPDDCDEHVDADGDGFCDSCGEPVEPNQQPDCEHVDTNKDGYCDICHDKVVEDVPGKDFYFDTEDGNVDIFVEGGLEDGITLGVFDVTDDHREVDLSGVVGEGYTASLGIAYEIDFYGTDNNVTAVSGRFVVRLLIPEILRTPLTRDLRIVYIAPDATVTEIESSRSGDYLVFETDHFSTYAIIEVNADSSIAPPDDGPTAEEPDIIDDDEGSWVWLWIVIIVLVVALAVVAVLFFLKRRDDNDGGDEPKTEEVAPAPEAPVAEEPKVEEPKVEEPKVEEPKVEEPKVEEPKVEEPAPEEPVTVAAPEAVPFVPPVAAGSDDDESTGRRIVNGQIVPVRYRTSFMSRLIQSEPPVQDYYTVVKNTLLSYNGVKARTSWNFESFNKGRIQCAKLNVKGNAFQVYLGLDPKEYSAEKYHFVDVSDKPKLDKVPMMIKVKSDRALKYSLELVEEVMKKYGIEQGEMPNDDYHLPYESTEALVDRDLVKIILPEGMVIDANTVIERINVGDFLKDVVSEETKDEFMHVDATVADTIMSDEEAKELIEIVDRASRKPITNNKLYEINIDTICENYENGETVDIVTLKDKNLVTKKAEKIKVLARGVMSKRLTVVADKFSIQAVKMIGLAGGTAKRYKD